MVSSTPLPHFTPGKYPVPILQEAGWAPGPEIMHNTILIFLIQASLNNGIRNKIKKQLGVLLYFVWKRRLQNILSNFTYFPSHRQADAPTINMQPTLRTAPDLCKNVSLAVLFVSSSNSNTFSKQSDMCMYVCMRTHILHSIEILIGQKKLKKIWTVIHAACQGNLSKYHSAHACLNFFSPVLELSNASEPLNVYLISITR